MCEQLVRSTEKCAINFKRDKEFSAKSDDTPKITKQRTERKHWNRKSQLRRGRGLLHLSNYIYSYIDSTKIWELDFIESLYCCCWLLSLSSHIVFGFGFVCHLAHIKVISRIFWWIATKTFATNRLIAYMVYDYAKVPKRLVVPIRNKKAVKRLELQSADTRYTWTIYTWYCIYQTIRHKKHTLIHSLTHSRTHSADKVIFC